MAKWKVRILGLGKIGNNVKNINEEFEVEESVINDLRNSSTKAQVIEGLLLTRLPGVVVDGNKLQLQTEEIHESIFKNKKVQDIGTSAVAGAVGGIIASKTNKKATKVNDVEIDETLPFGDNLKEITKYQWNGDLQDTINKLKNISIQTSGHNWVFNPSSNIQKENNRILSACLKQYKVGFKYYKKQVDFKEIRRGKTKLFMKNLFGKYWPFLIFVGVLIVVLIGIILE